MIMKNRIEKVPKNKRIFSNFSIYGLNMSMWCFNKWDIRLSWIINLNSIFCRSLTTMIPTNTQFDQNVTKSSWNTKVSIIFHNLIYFCILFNNLFSPYSPNVTICMLNYWWYVKIIQCLLYNGGIYSVFFKHMYTLK